MESLRELGQSKGPTATKGRKVGNRPAIVVKRAPAILASRRPTWDTPMCLYVSAKALCIHIVIPSTRVIYCPEERKLSSIGYRTMETSFH